MISFYSIQIKRLNGSSSPILEVRLIHRKLKANGDGNLPHSVHEIPRGHHIAIVNLPIATIAGILVEEIIGTFMLF